MARIRTTASCWRRRDAEWGGKSTWPGSRSGLTGDWGPQAAWGDAHQPSMNAPCVVLWIIITLLLRRPAPVIYTISSALHNPYQGNYILSQDIKGQKTRPRSPKLRRDGVETQSQAFRLAHFWSNLLALGRTLPACRRKEEASKVW